MRHPALENPPYTPLDAVGARAFDDLLANALREDRAEHDVTTAATVPASRVAGAEIVAREDGVCAGLWIALRAFALLDERVHVEAAVVDGSLVAAGQRLATVAGPARALLSAERTALNLLGHLSGIASLTRRYVDAIAGTRARIADTRKTLPGLRPLERYAVRAGGGVNHRFSLADAVLVKDNHVAAVGSVAAAVKAARAAAPSGTIVEAECDTLAQVEEALAAGADAVLLDNMGVGTTRAAVELARGWAATEASGNVTLERARALAQTGVDVISVGALTRSAPSLDVALDFQT